MFEHHIQEMVKNEHLRTNTRPNPIELNIPVINIKIYKWKIYTHI